MSWLFGLPMPLQRPPIGLEPRSMEDGPRLLYAIRLSTYSVDFQYPEQTEASACLSDDRFFRETDLIDRFGLFVQLPKK